MLDAEHVAKQAFQNSQDIAALRESLKSAHKRIDENDRITDGVYKLAANIEALAVEVKMLAERMDNSIERIEKGLKTQGGADRRAGKRTRYEVERPCKTGCRACGGRRRGRASH